MAIDPVTAGLQFGGKILDLADQFIEDKDAKAKFAFELSKLQSAFSTSVITTQTTPKVDAVVKLMYAWRDVGVSLVRPIGSAVAAAFAAYCVVKGITLPDWLEAAMVALFPGWMVSRHIEKSATKKAEVAEKQIAAQKEVAQSGSPFWWPQGG